jgi:hypothetical protein
MMSQENILSAANHLPIDLNMLDWASYDCYDFLGCRVALGSNSIEFTTHIRRLLRSFPAIDGEQPDLTFSFVLAPSSDQASSQPLHCVYRNGEQLGCASDYWQLFRLMEWQLDIFLSETVRNYLLLHAGVVAYQGNGLIFPASSGNGKSSLTLALLLQNYRYLSDELAVIDPATGELSAFPKPFSLKNPRLFPQVTYSPDIWLGLEPSVLSEISGNAAKPVWYIHADDLKPHITYQGTVPIRYIIFPKYEPASSPQLEPLTAGQAMRQLLDHCVNFTMLGQGGLSLLARLVAEAQCFALTVNGPEATTKLITQLF